MENAASVAAAAILHHNCYHKRKQLERDELLTPVCEYGRALILLPQNYVDFFFFFFIKNQVPL